VLDAESAGRVRGRISAAVNEEMGRIMRRLLSREGSGKRE